jgi:hypothetical protein
MNPMLQAMLQKQLSGGGLFGNQNQQQPQQVQLGAAQASAPQAQISQGPVVNPVMRQQILNQLRGY